MGYVLYVAVDMCINYSFVHLLYVGLRVDHLTADKRCAFKVTRSSADADKHARRV